MFFNKNGYVLLTSAFLCICVHFVGLRPCAIQEAMQELHEALAGGGGGATFIMDDGYCYGRSEEVLPAIRRFADRLTDLGLHLQFRKCSYYSPRTLQAAVRRDLDALGISPGGMRRTPEGDEATQTEVCITQPFLPGITVGGGPLGHEAFIRQYMSTLTAGFVSYIRLRSISSSPPRRSRLGPACTAPYRPGWISGCSTSRRRRRRPRATRVRPEPPMSSRRERRSRACATAAAKPTWERSVEIMKDRASSMERAPSKRH